MREPRGRRDWREHRRPTGRHSRNAVLPPRAAAPLIVAILVILACQSAPTDSVEPPADGTQLTSLEIVAPPTLLVHDVALLSAKVLNASGQQVFQSSVGWKSSDPSIVSVAASGATSGIVTAFRRGTVIITATSGNVGDTVTLKVGAQLRIQPDYLTDLPEGWPMAIGDVLQLTTVYADVNGNPIPDVPSVTWSSTNTAAVSVGPTGLVAAHQGNMRATVTVTSPDDTASVPIHVLDVLAGQPASVRLVHGIPGLGPVRFLLTQGSAVSLSYGESVELPILSGTLRVAPEGLPPVDPMIGGTGEFLGVVRPGDQLSLYAVGSPQAGYLQAAWPTTASVAADSGLVRLIQSSSVLVVSLRSHGEPATGLPELCYFDPSNVSQYFARAVGDFDIIGQEKYGQQQEVGRVVASAPGGHAVTMVLTGGGQQPLDVLTFLDR